MRVPQKSVAEKTTSARCLLGASSSHSAPLRSGSSPVGALLLRARDLGIDVVDRQLQHHC